MSELEIKELSNKINFGLNQAYFRMLERKIKLGQSVVIADDDGNPITVSAVEAMEIFRGVKYS